MQIHFRRLYFLSCFRLLASFAHLPELRPNLNSLSASVISWALENTHNQYYNDLQHSITTANNEKQVLKSQFFGNIFIS